MKKGLRAPTISIYVFLIGLLIYFIASKNFEFIGYAVLAGLLYAFVLHLDKKYDFPTLSIWLFAIWIVSHMLGGAVHIGSTRLYDLMLLNLFNGGGEFVILKYDQLIHTYCFFTIGILVYYALKSHFKNSSKTALVLFSILATLGVSLLNEIIEFAMVIFADAATEVGGYYNTALDMVFNLVGAALGTTFAKDILDQKK